VSFHPAWIERELELSAWRAQRPTEDLPKPSGEENMADQKSVMEMTSEEYRAHKAQMIRNPPGLTAAQRAELAALRALRDEPKSATEMSREEFGAAKAKAIRDSYP
jgi:hypothetical protein